MTTCVPLVITVRLERDGYLAIFDGSWIVETGMGGTGPDLSWRGRRNEDWPHWIDLGAWPVPDDLTIGSWDRPFSLEDAMKRRRSGSLGKAHRNT